MKTIRKIYPPEQVFFLSLALFFVCLMTSCNTRIEGCLDANAENFDFDADKACSSCCTYPTINLSLSQKWNDRNFSPADTLYDLHNQPYQITDLKYFLSNWSWKDVEGNYYIVDSVKAVCDEVQWYYSPDIPLIDARQFLYPLGTIRNYPVTDSLFFQFGLTEDFSCLDPEDPATPINVTDNSPLWNPETSMLETIRLIVKRDLLSDQLDTVFITTNVEFDLDYDEPLEKGLDSQWDLSVNYALWFQAVDVSDLSSFANSLLQNIPGSITRTP